jgi:uncharacterized membrane protein
MAATETLPTRAWNCQTTGYIVSSGDRSSNQLWLFMPGETLLLAPTAASETYAADRISIRFNGPEALLEINGQQDACRENRKASIREAAKLRGVDFWATGNEPPWWLELSSQLILLQTGYERVRHEFAAVQPVVDAAVRTTIYTTRHSDSELVITLIGQACTDSMSGDEFSTAVTVEFDNQTFRGCGTALH